MPMSITRTSPTRREPGATYRPIFGAWFVVVTLARIAGPSTSPVAALTPDGTSAATTGAPAALIAAMTPTSRLLIIELVLREGNAPGFGSADMMMMTLTGGAERTPGEFESLLARAGLPMTRVAFVQGECTVIVPSWWKMMLVGPV